MSINLLIIHPSEIIRNGLFRVVNTDFFNEISFFSSAKDIDITFEDATTYVFLCDVNNLENLPTLENAEVLSLGMSNGKADISLYTSKDELNKIIEKKIDGLGSELEPKSETDLSAREIDVLKQVAHGLSNKEIAETLHISIHTVITHRKKITQKLGIKSISGLTIYALINKYVSLNAIDNKGLV